MMHAAAQLDFALAPVAAALAEPDPQLRLFGKPAVSGRRRMAVTLARAGTIAAARAKACAAAEKISVQLD